VTREIPAFQIDEIVKITPAVQIDEIVKITTAPSTQVRKRHTKKKRTRINAVQIQEPSSPIVLSPLIVAIASPSLTPPTKKAKKPYENRLWKDLADQAESEVRNAPKQGKVLRKGIRRDYSLFENPFDDDQD
jgi:hypothetical protein